MTRLTDLHKRLSKLRRRRQAVRWETAYSALLLTVLWILACLFFIDWWLEMDRLLRVIALLACAGIGIWAFRRYTLPWLGRKETELDMALLVERQEHIDSDLIAAVQFESPEAPEWGSVQLEEAVIEMVAASGQRIDVMRGISRKELSRRSILLAVTVVLWIAVAFAFHEHVGTFFNRLLLGSMHYPTSTVIESIEIAGNEVDPIHPQPLGLLYGQAVPFKVRCSKDLPDKGRIELTAMANGLPTTLLLAPVTENAATYTAELPRLIDSVRYRIFIGDAWTDPAYLNIGQLPLVEIQLEVDPPAYAKTKTGTSSDVKQRGLRHVSVIEGSRVLVRIFSNKPLTRATLTADDQAWPLRGVGPDGSAGEDPPCLQWLLDSDDSPLKAVTEQVRFSVQVTDEEQLQLDKPIDGIIRIQADSAPRIAAAVVTEYVLPAAKPTIYLKAVDDYGLAGISMDRKVIRADGQTEESQAEIHKLPAEGTPKKTLEATYPFDLATLQLKKGDRVEVTLCAVDFRGDREGKSARAEPLIFQVTDEQGILAHMAEADRQSARQLKTMIQRQLGIGESP